MGGVLPLSASPRSLFLSTWTVSHQMVRQSFKSLISFFKKFRWMVPGGSRSSRGGSLLVGNNIWWLLFSSIPLSCVTTAVHYFRDHSNVSMISVGLVMSFMLASFIMHFVVLFSVVYWYRDMPFQLIGAKAKFMIEVVPMITAAALHHLLEFNYGYLALLLGCSTYIYTFAHFLHVAYDIRGIDVLLGIVMQVLAYTLCVELLVRALALGFCFGLCLYRYITYCAPDVPPHSKKELELLPC